MTADVSRCIRGDGAPCECACPFHLDVRSLCDKLRRGSFDAAFNLYRNAVAFPDLVSRLCPAPCRGACTLRSAPVELPALEAAAVRWARSRDPLPFRIPPKEKTVAVVGAGAAGLACTLRLASKGYQVTVYEREAAWGGSLRDKLPEDVWQPELERQFKYTKNTTFLTGHAVASPDELRADAVFLAPGRDGADFGLREGTDPVTGETARAGFFLGGELTEPDTVRAIASGLRAARYMERFLMTGRMLRDSHEDNVEPGGVTRLVPSLFPTENGAAVPVGAEGYGRDGAKAEAGRCLRCDCEQCLSRCDFLRYERVEPRTMAERVAGEFVSDGKITEGNSRRLIDGCNLCGACGDHCPEGIDLGEFLLESRRRLHREEKLPPAWHDFWVRDMVFACSDEASLCRGAPSGRNEYVYFPGCQLGASDPRYVTESYRALLRARPDTGLLLACCGAGADWAGREDEHAARLDALRAQWESLGRPVFILACPSCRKRLEKYLPEIPLASVYALLAADGLRADGAGAAIFDACASRGCPEIQESVRALLPGAAELSAARGEALCCGYGGQIEVSNPALHAQIVTKRAGLGEAPYVCECTNCRDTFAAAGKEAQHVFDRLFALSGGRRPAPGATERRDNRRALKKAVLREFWDEEWEVPEPMKLTMDAALRARLDRELILDDDLRAVIGECEATGRKLRDEAAGTFLGHRALGPVTYWVEYAPEGDGWRVLNAYSHRLEIVERPHNG